MKIQIVPSGLAASPKEVTPVLALCLLGIFACVLGGSAFVDKDLFKTLSQGLLNIMIALAAYYWGSSQGSQKKDDTIAKAMDRGVPADDPGSKGANQ